MIELYNLGLNNNDINTMLEICPTIKDLTNDEILTNIKILKSINCNDRHIKNIIISNPMYLNRLSDDIIFLINKLKQLNISNINLLFDTNPFLLNKDAYEIDEYINFEIKKGKELEDIIDEFESNPYIIDEI